MLSCLESKEKKLPIFIQYDAKASSYLSQNRQSRHFWGPKTNEFVDLKVTEVEGLL